MGEDDPMEADGATPSEKRPPEARWLALALIIAAGAAIAFAFLWNSEKITEPAEVTRFLQDESGDVEEVAIQVIKRVVDYDADTIEDNREELLPLVTGGFLEDYEELLGGDLGEILAETNTVSEGDILDGPTIGFVSATRAGATARVVQRVRTDASADDRLVLLVLRLGMVVENDVWKAEKLQILSQQSPGSD
ncbi:MAG: hypothetical protein ACR2KQ_02640 [Actinomycetota bacterium]